MSIPADLNDYLRAFGQELANRILQSFPPLQGADDPLSPLLGQLLRQPYPAQAVAAMGVARRWEQARTAALIAECGAGKTLIALAAMHVHSKGKPYTALAMVPPQLCDKTARESFLTLPRVRVFFIDGLRDPTHAKAQVGVNEVKLRNGRIVREGLHTSLTELRLRKNFANARERWASMCSTPAVFVVGRDRGKLGYFWRHAYGIACSGRYQGSVINPDSGAPVIIGEAEERLLAGDFKKAKLGEIIGGKCSEGSLKERRRFYSALWQADGNKIRRFSPVDYVGRYMNSFF